MWWRGSKYKSGAVMVESAVKVVGLSRVSRNVDGSHLGKQKKQQQE